jgi:hypothetical protein
MDRRSVAGAHLGAFTVCRSGACSSILDASPFRPPAPKRLPWRPKVESLGLVQTPTTPDRAVAAIRSLPAGSGQDRAAHVPRNAETRAVVGVARRGRAACGGTRVGRAAIPAAAAGDAGLSRVWALWVVCGGRAVVVPVVPIGTPLPGISPARQARPTRSQKIADDPQRRDPEVGKSSVSSEHDESSALQEEGE